jgi:hypothetical protein
MGHLSRRDFLKLGFASLGTLAFNPFSQQRRQLEEQFDGVKMARVAIKSVSVYSQPSDESKILYQRYRDDLVNIYYEVVSEFGPEYNPRWYRVWGGYIHSAHLHNVNYQLNPVLPYIPENGQLAEVTIPFSQSMTYNEKKGWQPLYRLYYQSVHWLRKIVEGPDGEPWYKIEDELDGNYIYYIPAAHLRSIPPSELDPISPDVDPWSKLIKVSISQQTVTCYEGEKEVFHTSVSTGLYRPIDVDQFPGAISTKTPTGKHNVQVKMPSKHMGDGFLTSDINAYELPGVPWCTFFEPTTGVAFHGTFWHTNYGNPMSHGCVNMRPEEAKWLYRWTTPVALSDTVEKRGYGTPVIVS